MNLKTLIALSFAAAALALGTSCQNKNAPPPSVDLTPGYVAPAK